MKAFQPVFDVVKPKIEPVPAYRREYLLRITAIEEAPTREATLLESNKIARFPHPAFAGVRVAWLVKRPAAPSVSCALVLLTPEANVPEHAHGEEDDILYVLRGIGRMWIEGRGDVPLEAGTFLHIPAGVRHRPHSFQGDLLAFNVWASNPASRSA